MKKITTLLTLSALTIGLQFSMAKTPLLTTPNMNDAEYAKALGFQLIGDDESKTDTTKADDTTSKDASSTTKETQKNADNDQDKPLPTIKKKDLKYRCDISLSQPFAIENQKKIELAMGVGEKDDDMIIKIGNTPIHVKKTHLEPEHLHIWSNMDRDLIMTLDVDEVYKDKFVASETGTLTVLTPNLKEEYKAVLSCKP